RSRSCCRVASSSAASARNTSTLARRGNRGSGELIVPGYAARAHPGLLVVGRLAELFENPVEVLDGRKTDLDLAFSCRQVDRDLRVEAVAELVRHLVEVRATGAGARFWARRRG